MALDVSTVKHAAASSSDFLIVGLWTGLQVHAGESFEFKVQLSETARERLGHSAAYDAIESATHTIKVSASLLNVDPITGALPCIASTSGGDLSVVISVAVPPHTNGCQLVVHSVTLRGNAEPISGSPLYITIEPVRLLTSVSRAPLAGTVVPGTMSSPCVSPAGVLFIPRGGVIAVCGPEDARSYVLQV